MHEDNLGMRVQATEGSLGFVDCDVERGICACGVPRCVHLEWASDVVLFRGKRSRWLVLSSLHKELRRGDVVAARHWASWLAHCDGPDAPLGYLRKIWSEETADLDLGVRLHRPSVTLAEAIAHFCAASKVWALPAWWTAFQVWQERVEGVGPRLRHKLVDRLARAQAKGDPVKLAHLRIAALAELTDRRLLTSAHVVVFQARFATERLENEDFLLAALLADLLPAQVNPPLQNPRTRVARHWTNGSTLRLPPAYAYDYHSRAGLARMRAWLEHNPGGEFTFGIDTSPVDLRWAGGLVPLFWRVQAWQQYGAAMDRLAWHELVVEPAALQRFVAWCGWWPGDMVGR